MEQTYYTPDQLADRLTIAVATLAKWRFQGVGPTYMKFGARVRYSERDIAIWLENSRQTPGASSIADF